MRLVQIIEDLGRKLRIGYDLDDVLADLDQILRQEVSKVADQTLELLNKIDDSPRKQPHRWFENKLNSALHAISEETKSLADILPNNKIIQKLLRWSYNNHNHTKSGDIHTSKVIANELRNGQRLVGNPDKQDVDAVDFEDFYVVDYGNQLLVSLPENADIIKLLLSYTTSDPTAHIIRGLAFGYKPSEVVWYYNIKQRDHNWVEYLHQHGLALSMDYTADGYASTVDNKKNVAYAIVEPGDIHQIQNIKLPIIAIVRWCPECDEYISERETDISDGGIPPDACSHTPQHTPDKPSGQRHWYMISYDISNVESLQPISEDAKFDPSRRRRLNPSGQRNFIVRATQAAANVR